MKTILATTTSYRQWTVEHNPPIVHHTSDGKSIPIASSTFSHVATLKDICGFTDDPEGAVYRVTVERIAK